MCWVLVRTPGGGKHDRDEGPAAAYGPGRFSGSLVVPVSTTATVHRVITPEERARATAYQREYRARKAAA